MVFSALSQEKLNSMMGKSSGFIETLPRQMRARIEFLRELQDKHDDLAEEYSKELKALREKYEALYGAPSRHTLTRDRFPRKAVPLYVQHPNFGQQRRTKLLSTWSGGSEQALLPLTGTLHADPLYKERSDVVLGKKEVPAEYADRSEETEEGAPEQAAAKAEPEKDEEPVAPGIPGFWLGAMRAQPLISEHVRVSAVPPLHVVM